MKELNKSDKYKFDAGKRIVNDVDLLDSLPPISALAETDYNVTETIEKYLTIYAPDFKIISMKETTSNIEVILLKDKCYYLLKLIDYYDSVEIIEAREIEKVTRTIVGVVEVECSKEAVTLDAGLLETIKDLYLKISSEASQQYPNQTPPYDFYSKYLISLITVNEYNSQIRNNMNNFSGNVPVKVKGDNALNLILSSFYTRGEKSLTLQLPSGLVTLELISPMGDRGLLLGERIIGVDDELDDNDIYSNHRTMELGMVIFNRSLNRGVYLIYMDGSESSFEGKFILDGDVLRVLNSGELSSSSYNNYDYSFRGQVIKVIEGCGDKILEGYSSC